MVAPVSKKVSEQAVNNFATQAPQQAAAPAAGPVPPLEKLTHPVKAPAPAPVKPEAAPAKAEQLLLQGRKCNVSVTAKAVKDGEAYFVFIANKFGEWSTPAGKVQVNEAELFPKRWQMLEGKADNELVHFAAGGVRETAEEAGLDVAPFLEKGSAKFAILDRDKLGIPELNKKFRTEMMAVDLGNVDELPPVKAGSDAKSARWVSLTELKANTKEEQDGEFTNRLLTLDGDEKKVRHTTWVAIQAMSEPDAK